MLRPVKPRQCKRANKIPTRPAFAFAVHVARVFRPEVFDGDAPLAQFRALFAKSSSLKRAEAP
jgi:hypothetical protein